MTPAGMAQVGGTARNFSLKDQNDRFVSFQTAVTSHVTKTNSHILELSRKLEELRGSVNSHEQGAAHENAKIGFVRRVFGGATSPHRK